MPPKKTPKPKAKKFASIPIAEIPQNFRPNPHEPDYRAAMAQVDAKPDQAVVIFDSMGDIKAAADYRQLLKRWLAANKLSTQYDAVKRQAKVYFWRTA